jgi:WD40 repeat protein
VLNVVIPQNFQKIIEEKQFSGLSAVPEDKLEQLYKPFNVKVVMAIRSDKMSLLNQLKDFLPNILNKTYELTPLNSNQAEDAILNPAYKKDEIFESSPFDFTDEALDTILGYLTKGGTQKIESFQLQIICQYAESLAIDQKLKVIDKHALAEINDIFENYYENLIQKLPTAEEQERARVFIEEKLIYEEDKTRLSIYEGQIYREYNVSKDLLKKLVNSHLIRPEPNTAGGFSYELSHDTLVEPILIAKAKRLEKKRIREMEEKAEALRLAELEEQQRVVQRQRLKYTKRLLVAMAVFVIISIGLTTWAFTASAIAKKQKAKVDQINDDLKAKHKTLDSTNLHLISSRKDLEKSIGQLNDKEDSLQLLLTQVDRQRQKAETAVENALYQMRRKDSAIKEWAKTANLLKLAIKKDSLEEVLINNAINSDEEKWFLELNEKQRRYAVEQLLTANSIEFASFKKSFLLAAKGKQEAKKDIILALQYINASKAINENNINASILSELEERSVYESKIPGQPDGSEIRKFEIKKIVYNKAKHQIVYTTTYGVFKTDLNDSAHNQNPNGEIVSQLLYDNVNPIVNSALSDNGNYILLAYRDNIKILDEDGSLIKQDSAIIDPYANIILSNNGQYFASAYYGFGGLGIEIYKQDTTNKSTDTFSIKFIPSFSKINIMKFTPDNNHLLYGSDKGVVTMVDLKSNEKRPLKQEKADKESSITALAISSNSQQILSGDNKGNIYLWDTASAKEKVSKLNVPVNYLEFRPDNKHFLFTHNTLLSGEEETDTLTENFDDYETYAGTETLHSNDRTYIKMGNLDGRGDTASFLNIIAHPSHGVALVSNNKIVTTNNGNLFIWAFNGKKVPNVSLNTLPPLPVAKQIENNLTTIEELLKSGSKSNLYEAIQYYSKEGEEAHYDKIEKLGSALESKFLPEVGKGELLYLKERLANAYDHSIEYDDLDSAVAQNKILKSITYRKQSLGVDTLNKDKIINTKAKWETMASSFEEDGKYRFALMYRGALNNLLHSLYTNSLTEDLIFQLTDSYLSTAKNYEELGKYEEALNYYLERSKVLDSAAKKFVENATIAQMYGVSYHYIAIGYNNLRKYKEALNTQFTRLQKIEAAWKIFPENKLIAESRLYTFYWIAYAYQMLKRYDSSVVYYQKYVNIAENIVHQFSDDENSADILLDAYFYLSNGQKNLRDYDKSLKTANIRIETAEKSHQRFPENVDIGNSWAVSYHHAALIYDKLKQYKNALAFQKKYNEAVKHVYNTFSENSTAILNYLGSYFWMGFAYDRLRNYDSAFVYRKKAASEAEAILERFPNNEEIIYDCMMANNLIGRGYERKRDYQNSLKYRNDYVSVAEHWHKKFPNNIKFVERLLWSYYELGSIQIKLKQYDSAGSSFQKFIDTSSHYSTKFTDSSGMLIDMSNVYEQLAEISLELGQYQKNVEYLKRANKLIDSVFNFDDMHPSNSVDIYSDLSASYAKLAIANVYLKNFSEAEKLIQHAVKLDSANTFVQLSLAEWHLVNQKFEGAEKIYLNIMDEPYYEFSYGEYALTRLEKMERAGLINAQDINVLEIKKYLKEP